MGRTQALSLCQKLLGEFKVVKKGQVRTVLQIAIGMALYCKKNDLVGTMYSVLYS